MYVCAECGASQPGPGTCAADGALLAPAGEDRLLGTTVGAYRVARLLGVGGMGRVYKGVHPQIGSRVAIKVLSRESSDRRDLVERFFAEAKAINLIRHESIVNVLDLATLPDGRPYIVMEYLDGAPLSSIIDHARRSGALPIGGLAKLVAEVLDALGAAHGKGIVHRDLKPDNIYVTPAGRAKVLDFGIAKLVPELGGSATQSGSLLGTPHYMSPEQAAGRGVDLRADLYAVGVILFECLTLHRPFSADALFDLLRKHIEEAPPSVRAQRADVPELLEHVVVTALAKAPERRFASAQAMSLALQQATAQLPPAQWTPVVPPASARAATPGAWAPTPPASWAKDGGGARTATGGGSSTTATSGQIVAGRRSRSRAGLLVAVAAVMLVGGGVTAALVLGDRPSAGGDATGGVASAAQGAPSGAVGSASPRESGSAGASDQVGSASAGSSSARGSAGSSVGVAPSVGSAVVVAPPIGSAGVAPAPESGGATAPRAVDSGKGSAGAPAAPPWLWSPEADRAMDDAFKRMPREVRKMMPKELLDALAKYGSWSKIPHEQRMPLLEAMGNVGREFAERNRPRREGRQPQAAADAPVASGTGDARWVKAHWLPLPGGLDAARVEGVKTLAHALGEAKKVAPDATLYRVDAMYVRPDGTVDLTADNAALLDYRFVSRARANEVGPAVAGAKPESCAFGFLYQARGVLVRPVDGECPAKPRGAPRCGFAQVWAKALAAGAPSRAVARLAIVPTDGGAIWRVSIGDKFSGSYPDDC